MPPSYNASPVKDHPDLIIYLALFVSSFVLVLVLTPISITLAKILGAMDYPNGRKVHSTPIPRLGGLAIAGAVAITILLGFAENPYIRSGLPTTIGMIAGLAIILIVGVYDDV